MYDRYSERARQEWNQVRRKALWTQFWASLRSKKIDMVDFTELSQHFDLGDASYRGVQSIPLDKIVGSVGRHWDFVQTFLPTHQGMSERWQRIARLYLDPTSVGVPPIEVYQVGARYFVDDGNHRISVAHQLKLRTINAHVWEFCRALNYPSGHRGGEDNGSRRRAMLTQLGNECLQMGN